MRRSIAARNTEARANGLRGGIEGTNKMKVTARITGLGRRDEALEQLVVRVSLEAGVSSVSWAVHAEVPE